MEGWEIGKTQAEHVFETADLSVLATLPFSRAHSHAHVFEERSPMSRLKSPSGEIERTERGKMVRNGQMRLDHHQKGDGQKKPRLLKGDGWRTHGASGGAPSMKLASVLEGLSLVALRLLPYSIDQPDPDVGQGTDRNGMAFALLPLALIVLQGPGFALRSRPSQIDAERCAAV
jgi:hypothetical protein